MSVNQFLNGKLNLIAGAGGGSVIADDNTFTGTTAEVEAAIADGLIEDDTIVFITDDFEETSGSKIEYVTQEEYDALPESKLTDNVEYRITDKGIDSVSASNVTYDGSASGIDAMNVQGAVDELKEELNNSVDELQGDISTLNESFNVLSKRLDQVNIKRYYLNPGKSISIEFNMDAFVLCGYSMSKGGFFIARMVNGSSNAYIEEIGTVPESISITANGNIHTITNNISWNIQVFVIS